MYIMRTTYNTIAYMYMRNCEKGNRDISVQMARLRPKANNTSNPSDFIETSIEFSF